MCSPELGKIYLPELGKMYSPTADRTFNKIYNGFGRVVFVRYRIHAYTKVGNARL